MISSRLIRFAVAIVALIAASPSHAIVIRHDRDDAAYRKLGKQYPMVCRLAAGHGTLIDSQWVLTAAHVGETLAIGKSVAEFGDLEISIARVVVHPDYGFEEKHRDLALVQLTGKITSIEPARLYRAHDEVGMKVTFIGDGATGTGKSGFKKGKRIRRGAQNTVSAVRDGWITFVFDAPPAGEPLEGSSGPGDSGGPALIEVDGEPYIIGVNAYGDDGKSMYGSNDMYVRVSDMLPWIEGVMSGEVLASKRPRLMEYGENEQGQATLRVEEPQAVKQTKADGSRVWDVVEQLTESVHSDNSELFMSLMSQRFVEQRPAADPVVGMHEFLVGAVAVRGPIAFFHPVVTDGYEIPDSKFPMKPVMFHLEDGSSGYFGVALDKAGKIDHLSVFVRNGLCDQGVACKRAVPLSEARKL